MGCGISYHCTPRLPPVFSLSRKATTSAFRSCPQVTVGLLLGPMAIATGVEFIDDFTQAPDTQTAGY